MYISYQCLVQKSTSNNEEISTRESNHGGGNTQAGKYMSIITQCGSLIPTGRKGRRLQLNYGSNRKVCAWLFFLKQACTYRYVHMHMHQSHTSLQWHTLPAHSWIHVRQHEGSVGTHSASELGLETHNFIKPPAETQKMSPRGKQERERVCVHSCVFACAGSIKWEQVELTLIE